MTTKHPIFTMLVGLPGSGKSTYARELNKTTGAVVISSDEIRKELYGNPAIQDDSNKVFSIVHARLKEALVKGEDAVFDATNLSFKKRMEFLESIKDIPCTKSCVIVAPPFDDCVRQNASREENARVPESVLIRLYKSWQTPHWFEGWDNIQVVNNKPERSIADWLLQNIDFDQQNPHHVHTLGRHVITVFDYITENVCTLDNNKYSEALFFAAALHDCGKPFCKSFNKEKQVMHFHNHAQVGGYDVFQYALPERISRIDVSTLVNLHMDPYFFNEKTDYVSLWGKDLYDAIMCLHEGDERTNDRVPNLLSVNDWLENEYEEKRIEDDEKDNR